MQIIELKHLYLMLASAIGSFPEFNSKDRNPDTLKTLLQLTAKSGLFTLCKIQTVGSLY